MGSSCGRGVRLLICAGLTFLVCGSAVARQDAPPPARASDSSRPEWGTKDRIFTHIGFNEFAPTPTLGISVSYFLSSAFGVYSVGGPSGYLAVAHVPTGAFLTYLELDYCDTNATADVTLTLYRCSYLGEDCLSLSFISSSTGSTGCHFVTDDLTGQGFTMDNNVYELVLDATTGGSDDTTSLRGVYIGYKLQISPAPATATFADVPTSHPYFRAIEALAKSGITQGCGGGNFCPNGNVTRGEMAAFLARALGLHFPN